MMQHHAGALQSAVGTLQASGLRGEHRRVALRSGRPQPQGPLLLSIELTGLGAAQLSVPAILDVAGEEAMNVACVAHVHQVDKRLVPRLRKFCAHMVMLQQERRLNVLQSSCDADGFAFFVSSLALDETIEKLALHVLAPTTSEQQAITSSWHVLVSTQSLLVGRRCSEAADSPAETYMMDLVRPTVPLMATTAACLHKGLFGVKCIAGIAAAEDCLLQGSDVGVCHFDRDGATNNSKLGKLLAHSPWEALGTQPSRPLSRHDSRQPTTLEGRLLHTQHRVQQLEAAPTV